MKIFSENAELAGRDKLRKHSSVSSGIARSQSVKNTSEFSDGKLAKQDHFARSSTHRMEDPNFLNSSKTLTAGTRGKTKSVKENIQMSLSQRQSKDCNPYATLPRASNVISTAEGTTRRTSIHDFLSKDPRQPISIDPSPPTIDRSVPSASSEYSPPQQSSCVFHYKPYTTVTLSENELGSIAVLDYSALKSEEQNSRTAQTNLNAKTLSCSSMDSEKIGPSISNVGKFSAVCSSRPFLSLNTELVSSVSGLPQKPVSKATNMTSGSSVKPAQKDNKLPSENQKSDDRNLEVTQNSSECTVLAHENTSESKSPLPLSEDTQTVWYEYGCV